MSPDGVQGGELVGSLEIPAFQHRAVVATVPPVGRIRGTAQGGGADG
jgi:hypothetical protein